MNKHIIEENGVKREYVEVDRKAEAGDKILVISYAGGFADIGDTQTVKSLYHSSDGSLETEEGAFFDTDIDDEYHVLEPAAPINAAEALADELMGEEPLKQAVDLIANLAHRVTQLERKTGELVRAKHAEDEAPEAPDMVEHPSHYNAGKFEVIEIIEEITKGYEDGYTAYCAGNAVKYLARAPYKHDDGGLEDLKKAAQYLKFAIAEIEGGR